MKTGLYNYLISDGSVIVSKKLIREIGLHESILFSELLSRQKYFEKRNLLDKQGYFFNTQYDLQAGTGLGEKAQRNLIKKLQELGLIKFKLKGMPQKRYFKVLLNCELLVDLYGLKTKESDKNKAEYKKYLKSEHWQSFRKEAIEHHGSFCSLCGGKEKISVHHLTYKNRGHENLDDVVVLCDSCHKEIHGIKAGNK